MKVKQFIGQTVSGFKILDSYKVILPSGASTRKVLVQCENCGRKFERNSGVNFEKIKCKCKCKYLQKKCKYHYIEYNGTKMTITDFCKKNNINVSTFSTRLKKGLSVEDALKGTYERVCALCGKKFNSKKYNTKYCSDTCRRRVTSGKGKYKEYKTFECIVCKKAFKSLKDNAKTCCRKCNAEWSRIDRNKRYKKLKEIGHFDNSVTLKNVFDKYNGICQCCQKQLNFDCDSKGNDYPSIDHIVPLSKGGYHEWDNVQLLCRHCNDKKSNK